MTFFDLELLIRVIASFIGSCSFAVVFNINKRHLLYVGILGAINYFAYDAILYLTLNVFISSFVATTAVTVCAEMLARKKRAPTIVYLVTGLIPIVPGSDAYGCMKHLLESNMAGAMSKLVSTVQIALGIAGGIVVVSIIFGIMNDHIAKKKQKQNIEKTTN
jgi:uncharacterized membrane protein YjjB (DUF3815 family)